MVTHTLLIFIYAQLLKAQKASDKPSKACNDDSVLNYQHENQQTSSYTLDVTLTEWQNNSRGWVMFYIHSEDKVTHLL